MSLIFNKGNTCSFIASAYLVFTRFTYTEEWMCILCLLHVRRIVIIDVAEVKVMSDLAMISAGEEPMQMDRVSCFLSAVMGFSPLIFDLAPSDGLSQLLEACELVWENVDRDPSLIKKWVNTV